MAALREHDRFLVVTHENPDGDALGSLLAMTLALRQLGKDVVMYLAGSGPLPGEYAFMQLDGAAARAARRHRRSGRSSPSTAQRRTGWGRTRPRSTVLSSSSTSTTTMTTRTSATSNLIVADASSTGEVLRDVFRELGVELTPEIAERSVHRPRDRHRPLPIYEHDAEIAAPRRGARRGGRRLARRLPTGLRVGSSSRS